MADPPFLEADPLKRPRPTGGKCPWSGICSLCLLPPPLSSGGSSCWGAVRGLIWMASARAQEGQLLAWAAGMLLGPKAVSLLPCRAGVEGG